MQALSGLGLPRLTSCISRITCLGFKPQANSKSPLKEDWERFTVHFNGLELKA
jgi:hypothetical protein